MSDEKKGRVNPSADEYFFIDGHIRDNTTQEDRDGVMYTVLNEGVTWDDIVTLINSEIGTDDRVFSMGHVKGRLGGRVFGEWCPVQRSPSRKSHDLSDLNSKISKLSKDVEEWGNRVGDLTRDVGAIFDRLNKIESAISELSGGIVETNKRVNRIETKKPVGNGPATPKQTEDIFGSPS